MKNKLLLFLILFSFIGYSQNPSRFSNGVQITGGQPTVTSTNFLTATDATGLQTKIDPVNMPLPFKASDNSAGAVEGFAVTNNGNGTVNIASGTAYLRATNDQYAPLLKFTIPAVTNLVLTDNANNFVLVDYNGGSPALTVTTNTATINTETNSIAIVISRVGTTLDYLSLVGQNVDANAKLRVRFLNQEGIRRLNGASIGFSARNLTLSAGVLASGLIRINSPAFNTASPDTFTQVYNNGAVWTRTTGQTQVNNTQYNNAGILTNLAVGDYRTDYIYLLPNNPSKLYLVLGTTSYTSITLARGATPPSSLPSELQTLGVLVGRCIIQRLAGSISEVSSAFDNVFPNAPVPEHNALAGLQGGTASDYQHLTTVQLSKLVNLSTSDVLNTSSVSPATTNTDALNALNTSKVGGSGIINRIAKFSAAGTVGSSTLSDAGAGLIYDTATGTESSISLRSGGTSFSKWIFRDTDNNALLFVSDTNGGVTKIRVKGSNGTINLNETGPGNVVIGSSIDNGVHKLQVSGNVRITSTLNLLASPTTSASTYDIVTRNTSTGDVEKITSNSVVASSWNGKTMVWFGTSIPETGYPQIVGSLLGATVTNEAKGSSMARRGSFDTTDGFGWTGVAWQLVAYSLSQTVAEKNELITNWATWRTLMTNSPPATLTVSDENLFRDTSYENRLWRHLTSKGGTSKDLYVFDHGHNDNLASDSESNFIDVPVSTRNRNTYIGSVNYLIDEILKDNPRAKIVFIGHYENARKTRVSQAQENLAAYWGFPLMKLWDSLGWSQNTVTDTSFWSDAFTWNPSGGASTTKTLTQIWMQDNLHPHSTPAKTLIAKYIAAWLENTVRQ